MPEIISVEQWEQAPAIVPDDIYEPVFYSVFGKRTVSHYEGRKTGVLLSPKFENVLDFISKESSQ